MPSESGREGADTLVSLPGVETIVNPSIGLHSPLPLRQKTTRIGRVDMLVQRAGRLARREDSDTDQCGTIALASGS